MSSTGRLGGACKNLLLCLQHPGLKFMGPRGVASNTMNSTRFGRPSERFSAPQRPLGYKSQARIPILCSSRTEMLHLQVGSIGEG